MKNNKNTGIRVARSTRPALPAKAPCVVCHQSFFVDSARDAGRKCCSRACTTRRKRAGKTKTCRKCEQALPYEQFPRSVWGTRGLTCNACYRPRKKCAVPFLDAPAPCLGCGERFRMQLPPSRINKRIYCSYPCSVAHRTPARKRCSCCHKDQPAGDFDYTAGGSKLSSWCRVCTETRQTQAEAGIDYMVTANRMLGQARMVATKRKVPFTLTREQALGMYRAPCQLCGKPSCVLACLYPEIGFVPEAVVPKCWPCAKYTGSRSARINGQVSDADVLRHARAIVAWSESA